MRWTDVNDIAIELYEAHPDVDPQYVNFVDLRNWVLALDGFEDDADRCGEKILDGIPCNHRKNNCLIKCLVGKVRFHFIDKKERELKKILNSNQNKLLKIPPNIWFCFESLAKKSLVVNLIERPHEDKEVNRSSKIKNYLIK